MSEFLNKETLIGSKKIAVGDNFSDLVLRTFGKVYIQTGTKFRLLDDFIKDVVTLQSNTTTANDIIFIDKDDDLNTIVFPGDDKFVFVRTSLNLYVTIKSVYVPILVQSNINVDWDKFVLKAGDVMTGDLELPRLIANIEIISNGPVTINTSGDQSPLIVNSTTLVENLNVEYLGGLKSEDYAVKAKNEDITGRWTFEDKTLFKEVTTFENDILVDGVSRFNNDLESATGFAPGMDGFGWQMDSETNTLTVDYLVVRHVADVYKAALAKISAVNGTLWLTDSDKIKEVVKLSVLLNDSIFDDPRNPNWWYYTTDNDGNIRQYDEYLCSGYDRDGTRIQFESGRPLLDIDDFVIPVISGGEYDPIGDLDLEIALTISPTEKRYLSNFYGDFFKLTFENKTQQIYKVNDIVRFQKFTDISIKTYDALVTNVLSETYIIVRLLRSDINDTEYIIPEAHDDLVRIGNISNLSRQYAVHLTNNETENPHIDILSNINRADYENPVLDIDGNIVSKSLMIRMGNLTGIEDPIFGNTQPQEVGLYGDNIYAKGYLYQHTGGETIRVTIYRGIWNNIKIYTPFDQITYLGSLYTCILDVSNVDMTQTPNIDISHWELSANGNNYDYWKLVEGTDDLKEINYGSLYNWYSLFTPIKISKYGYLYNAYVINNIAPIGWHVPTIEEWSILDNYASPNAPYKLKEVDTNYWITITGLTNELGFNSKGSGLRNTSNYEGLQAIDNFWASDILNNINNVYQLNLSNISSFIVSSLSEGSSIRLIKDNNIWNSGDIMIGNDGTTYNTIKIGDQVWLSENLIETKYNDGTLIPNIINHTEWVSSITGARCSYDNNESNAYDIVNYVNNICTTNAHIPTLNEYNDLVAYINSTNIGDLLKEIGYNHWLTPNTEATDLYGFNGRASGSLYEGSFNGLQQYMLFWLANETSYMGINAYYAALWYNSNTINYDYDLKTWGISVRLIIDNPVDIIGNIGKYIGNDGQKYKCVLIGNQWWLAENLIETKYRNGTLIPEIINPSLWPSLTTGAKCHYDNIENNSFIILPGTATLEIRVHSKDYVNFMDTPTVQWTKTQFLTTQIDMEANIILPIATNYNLGGIIVGNGLNIDSYGVLSVISGAMVYPPFGIPISGGNIWYESLSPFGNSLKSIRVKSDESGFEFFTPAATTGMIYPSNTGISTVSNGNSWGTTILGNITGQMLYYNGFSWLGSSNGLLKYSEVGGIAAMYFDVAQVIGTTTIQSKILGGNNTGTQLNSIGFWRSAINRSSNYLLARPDITGIEGTAGNQLLIGRSTYLTDIIIGDGIGSGSIFGTGLSNAYIRFPNYTEGILFTTSIGLIKRLIYGTSGQFLMSNGVGNDPVWSSIPLTTLTQTLPILLTPITGGYNISHSIADGYLHVPATGTINNNKVLTAGSTVGSISWQSLPSGMLFPMNIGITMSNGSTSSWGTTLVGNVNGQMLYYNGTTWIGSTNDKLIYTEGTISGKLTFDAPHYIGTELVQDQFNGRGGIQSYGLNSWRSANSRLAGTLNLTRPDITGLNGDKGRQLLLGRSTFLTDIIIGDGVTGTDVDGGNGLSNAYIRFPNYTQGLMLFDSQSVIRSLTHGINGKFLMSNGPNSTPSWETMTPGGGGTVTSVGLNVPLGLTITSTTTNPITISGVFNITLTSGYSIPLISDQNYWTEAYNNMFQWNGGSTNLNVANALNSLGGTTIGISMFTLPNPEAITFPQFNANNTVSALSASAFRYAIGAGTGNGTVTSILTSGAITGGPINGSGTISHLTIDGYLHVPATGTVSAGKVLTAGPSAGELTWVTPTSQTQSDWNAITGLGVILNKPSGTPGYLTQWSSTGTGLINSIIYQQSGTRYIVAGRLQIIGTGVDYSSEYALSFKSPSGHEWSLQQSVNNDFSIWGFNTTTWNEKFRITVGGNVGIGSINPIYKLQLEGGAMWIKPNTTGIYSASLHLGSFSDSSSPAYTFYTNDSTGDMLDIHSNRWTSDFKITRESSTGVKNGFNFTSGDGGNTISLINGANTLTNVVINSDGNSYFNGGNIGIGYTSGTEITNYKLSVNGSGYFNTQLQSATLKVTTGAEVGKILVSDAVGLLSYKTIGEIGGLTSIGSGTPGRLPIWLTGGVILGDSPLFSDGTRIALGNGTTFTGGTYMFELGGALTNSLIQRFSSTGGNMILGLGSSVANGFFTNSTIYSGNIGTLNATDFNIGTNSVARITVTSTGNVGIGTTTSLNPLEVKLSTNNTNVTIGTISTSENPHIDLQRYSGTTALYYGIRTKNNNGTYTLEFSNTANIGTQTWTEKFRLLNTGFLGIGLPSGAIPIYGFQNANRSMMTTNQDFVVNSAGSGIIIGLGASSGSTYSTIYSFVSGGTGTNNLALQSIGGTVSIGKTTGTAILEIKGGTATAGTAPLKINSGALLTVEEAGAIQNSGTHLYWTSDIGTRYQLDQFTTQIVANNGISIANSTIQLGGSLIQPTTIDTSTFGLTLNGNTINNTLTVGTSLINASAIAGISNTNTGGGTGGAFLSLSLNGFGVIGYNLAGGIAGLFYNYISTTSNTISDVLEVRKTTGASSANGIGASIKFALSNNIPTIVASNYISSTLTSVINGAHVANLIFSGYGIIGTWGLHNILTLKGSGQLQLNNYGATTALYGTGTLFRYLGVDSSGNVMEVSAPSTSGMSWPQATGIPYYNLTSINTWGILTIGTGLSLVGNTLSYNGGTTGGMTYPTLAGITIANGTQTSWGTSLTIIPYIMGGTGLDVLGLVGQSLRVNSARNAYEWYTPSSTPLGTGVAIVTSGIWGTPITGTANQVLRVNSTGTGYEFYSIIDSSGGTVLNVSRGNGMNFTDFNVSGIITLGTPSTITSISTNSFATNSLLNDSHTHALDNTGVIANTYTNATIIVDIKGRIISATNGITGTSMIWPTPVINAGIPYYNGASGWGKTIIGSISGQMLYWNGTEWLGSSLNRLNYSEIGVNTVAKLTFNAIQTIGTETVQDQIIGGSGIQSYGISLYRSAFSRGISSTSTGYDSTSNTDLTRPDITGLSGTTNIGAKGLQLLLGRSTYITDIIIGDGSLGSGTNTDYTINGLGGGTGKSNAYIRFPNYTQGISIFNSIGLIKSITYGAIGTVLTSQGPTNDPQWLVPVTGTGGILLTALSVTNLAGTHATYNNLNGVFNIPDQIYPAAGIPISNGTAWTTPISITTVNSVLNIRGDSYNFYGINFILVSDKRLKTHIKNISNEKMDINYKEFEMLSELGQKRYGVLAQDLLITNPEFVSGNEEDGYAVRYIDLLIKEVSYLKDKVMNLEKKLYETSARH